VLGVAIAVAVGFALMAARDTDDPTWEYMGEQRDCADITNVEFATRSAFEAWDEACSSG
jgi:hypothetical protein